MKRDDWSEWRPAVEVDIPTEWDENVHGWIRPAPWSKLYHTDGALWISESRSGRVDELHNYIYYRKFLVPWFGDYISRATIWLACDDSADVFVNGRYCGSSHRPTYNPRWPHFFNLTRLDITSDVDTGGNVLEIVVYNTRMSYTGLIYYLSVDYGKDAFYTEEFDTTGWYLLSLPLRPSLPDYPNLASIYDGIGAFAYIWMPREGEWNAISKYAYLSSVTADSIRTYSFYAFVLAGSYGRCKGYPIYEQRYLDLQPFVHDYNWENPWFMEGMVYCDVPFDWRIGQPDDEPDGATDTTLTIRAGIKHLRYELHPFEGYFSKFNHVEEGSPTDSTNVHLDIRCSDCLVLNNAEASLEITENDLRESSSFFAEWLREHPVNVRGTVLGDTVETFRFEHGSSPANELLPSPPVSVARQGHGEDIFAPKTEIPVLITAYPNPFNSEVGIYYFVPGNESREITVKIFDINGKLLKIIDSGTKSPGNHMAKWDATDMQGQKLDSGVYLYSVEYDGKVQTGKLLLIK